MSDVIYSGRISAAAAYKTATPFNVTTHAVTSSLYRPTVLVQIDFGNGSISLHLSPEDAAAWSEHLKLADEAALDSEVVA